MGRCIAYTILCYNRTGLLMSPVTNGSGHNVTMKLIAGYLRSCQKTRYYTP